MKNTFYILYFILFLLYTSVSIYSWNIQLFQIISIVTIIKPKKMQNAKNKFVTGSYYVRIVKKTRVAGKYQF